MRKCASTKNCSPPRRAVFFISPQIRATLQENDCRYDQTASGGLLGGVNWYTYSPRNPLFAADPKGLYSVIDIGRAIRHRCSGSGESWHTDFNSINWGSSFVFINQEINRVANGVGSCQPRVVKFQLTSEGQTSGADALIIGRNTIFTEGSIEVSCDCRWKFTGSTKSKAGFDPYDFDPSNRGWIGEMLTAIGGGTCPETAKDFLIYINGQRNYERRGVVYPGDPTCCH